MWNKNLNEIEYLDYRRPQRKRQRRYQQVSMEAEDHPVSQEKGYNKIMLPEMEEKILPQELVNDQPDHLGQQLINQQIVIEAEAEGQVIEVDKGDEQILQLFGNVPKHSKKISKNQLEKYRSKLSRRDQEEQNITKQNNNKSSSDPIQQQVKGLYQNHLVSLSLKSIYDIKQADVLFVPFATNQFQYLPGTILKQQLKNARQKLGKIAIKPGGVYFKNKLGIHNYKFIVFLKIDMREFSKNFAQGTDLFLAQAQKQGLQIRTFVFCLDKQMTVQSILQGIQGCQHLKKIKNVEFFLLQSSQSKFNASSSQLTSIFARSK